MILYSVSGTARHIADGCVPINGVAKKLVQVLYGDPSNIARQVFPSKNDLGELLLVVTVLPNTGSTKDVRYYFLHKLVDADGNWTAGYEMTDPVLEASGITLPLKGLQFQVQCEAADFAVTSITPVKLNTYLLTATPQLTYSNPAYQIGNGGWYVVMLEWTDLIGHRNEDWRLKDILRKYDPNFPQFTGDGLGYSFNVISYTLEKTE
ncbi:MAG: hypothetical protein LBQ66_09075 [Planctomycetaceae bacterium]|jgi:hypothetical protein|nr:hypothetical protein [Planctomycetaceae bacterium]